MIFPLLSVASGRGCSPALCGGLVLRVLHEGAGGGGQGTGSAASRVCAMVITVAHSQAGSSLSRRRRAVCTIRPATARIRSRLGS